jgi:hypothetical protein
MALLSALGKSEGTGIVPTKADRDLFNTFVNELKKKISATFDAFFGTGVEDVNQFEDLSGVQGAKPKTICHSCNKGGRAVPRR